MEASTAIQSRLIGTILVQKNMITHEQLERALQLQADSGDRLGEIVVAEFGVSRLELASVLAEQWAELEDAERNSVPAQQEAAVAPLTPGEVQIRRPIGEIFVELGFVSSDQLDAALDVQRETGARIGEILVEQGSLTRLDLASALAEQWSALQKLRPPAPAPEPTPWQNGVPVAPPPAQALSAEDRATVSDLEERLRVVERGDGPPPWQEDLRLVTSELRAAVKAVESRLEAAAGAHADKDLEPELEVVKERLAALEAAPDPNELDVLRASLEELRARPVTVEGLAELREAVERVEARPDPAAEVAQLTTDIAALTSRFDAISAVDDLAGRLDAVAEQAEVAQTGIDGLSRRVEELGRLETRLDGVAAGLPGAEAIEELRRELTELSAQAASDDRGDQTSENAALVARLDQVESRIGDATVSALPDPTPRIDELSARIDEIAEVIPSLDPGALQARVDAVEALATRGPDVGAVEELRARVEELALLAAREPDLAPVDELRARVDELAAVAVREPDLSAVDELRARVEELAVLAGREPDLAPVDELRARVEELAVLAGREPDLSAVDELRAKMDELAAVAMQEPDLHAVEELRTRVEELALLAAREPDPAPLDELRARIDELETRPHDSAPVDALRARLDELAAVVELATASRQKIHARVDWLAGELATTIAAREPDGVALGELRSRLDAVAAAAERGPDTAALDEIRGRVEKLAARAGNDELIGALEARVTQLEEQLVAATLAAETPAAELREEMRRVAESTVVERESLAQSLFARVEEITSTVPREDELMELRTRFDELAARPTQDQALQERVEQLGARIDGLGSFEGAITGLRESIDGLEAVRVGDALAAGARLAALETAVESLGALEDRVREGVARDLDDRAGAFAARLSGAESRLDAFAALEERIAGLAADLERRPDTDTLEEVVAAIRAEVDELAARPTVVDPSDRLQELSGRIDSLEQDGHERAGGLSDELSRRIGELATDLSRQIQALVERTDGLVSREEAAEQTALVRDGLAALRLAAEDRDAAVDASLAEADHARIAAHEKLGQTIADLRAELDDRARLADGRLAEEIAGVRSELRSAGERIGLAAPRRHRGSSR